MVSRPLVQEAGTLMRVWEEPRTAQHCGVLPVLLFTLAIFLELPLERTTYARCEQDFE